MVQQSLVYPFYAKFTKQTRIMSKLMKKAVDRALSILAKRGKVGDAEFSSYMEWANAEGGYLHQVNINAEQFAPQTDEPIPQLVQDCLDNKDIDRDDIKDNDCVDMLMSCDDAMEEESAMKLTDTLACMGCSISVSDIKPLNKHPEFEGYLCLKCKPKVEIALYATEEDGSGCLCIICGTGGLVIECDNCRRAYCASCVRKHTGGKTFKTIMKQDIWNCFSCAEYNQSTHGRLKRKADSDIELIRFSDPNFVELAHGLRNLQQKRKIRVLSLFDGVATAKLVLDKLGFVVEKYYACEVDKDAIRVGSRLDNIEYIGNAWDIDDEMLKKICPIDLVLGGPPCNDLSLVNPKRKGLFGTGILVSKFVDILLSVKVLCNKTNHVFYLMENSGHLPRVFEDSIKLFYSSNQGIWEATNFTGMRRRRFFWGNIPGLQCPAKHRQHLKKEKTILAQSIVASQRRVAQVTESRTITTHTNSHTIHNGQKDTVVTLDGQNDLLWESELENMFGFPPGYTDIGRMTYPCRTKVIGKAWCVQMICKILEPLRDYFLLKDDLPNTSSAME